MDSSTVQIPADEMSFVHTNNLISMAVVDQVVKRDDFFKRDDFNWDEQKKSEVQEVI